MTDETIASPEMHANLTKWQNLHMKVKKLRFLQRKLRLVVVVCLLLHAVLVYFFEHSDVVPQGVFYAIWGVIGLALAGMLTLQYFGIAPNEQAMDMVNSQVRRLKPANEQEKE